MSKNSRKRTSRESFFEASYRNCMQRELPKEHLTLETAGKKYQEYLLERNYSPLNVRKMNYHLRDFFIWCAERDLKHPEEITRAHLERYQKYLFNYRKKDGAPLSSFSQRRSLTSIQALFKWLAKSYYIMLNPASELDLPRKITLLPRDVLTQEEAEKVLNTPDIRNIYQLRDRVILEVFYSTGIRRTELTNLKIWDINLDRRTVFIKEGKGKKDRIIPISKRAVMWIEKYLREVRPQLVRQPDENYLFINQRGEKFSAEGLTHWIREYVIKSGVGKKGSCHLFRHTMATLMLENGADTRYIQEMLGHSSLETTQIYTKVSIRKLQEVYDLTHPSKLEKTRDNAKQSPADARDSLTVFENEQKDSQTNQAPGSS